MKNYLKTFSQISKILGGGTAAHKYLNKCMFTVGIGSNDFINNYFMPDVFRTSELYSLDRFVATLIDQYSQNLKVSDIYIYIYIYSFSSINSSINLLVSC